MIDLHSHILPGVDDGSPDLDTTEKMLSQMMRQGVQTVAATPHFYATQDNPEAFLTRRAEALEKTLSLQGDYPTVIPGAEVAYFDGMGRSDALAQLQLGSSGLILIEMPFCAWTQRMVQELQELRKNTGLMPVLAHINRYRSSDQLPKFARQLLAADVLFQCNAEAFLHIFSRGWAIKQLKEGNIHFLGSDAHNLTNRPPKLHKAIQVIEKAEGSSVLVQMDAYAKSVLKI